MSSPSKSALLLRSNLHLYRTLAAFRSRAYCTEGAGIIVPVSEVTNFIERCMTAAGTRPKHATALADNLTAADHRGHFSHGLNRLEMYVRDIKTGVTVSDCEPMIVQERSATGYVDGCNLLGPVVGTFCMDLAINKARNAGIGFVSAKGSNHYGIAGAYAMQASKQRLLGMSFTNTSPLVLPTRGREPIVGTNPLSLAAPARDPDSFVLDMATSAVAVGKIELNAVKKEPIPSGWGADSTGRETRDPDSVLDGGGLLPLGGAEINGGYKGYGLGMLVEIFCGILADAAYGPNIRKWKTTGSVANLGQCFIAINPEAFAAGFTERMQDYMNICRQQPPATGSTEVLVAGDPERRHVDMCDAQGGIRYHPNVVHNMTELAKELGVDPLQTL